MGAPRGIATLGFVPPSWRVCVQLPSPAGWAGWSDERPLEVRLAGSVISRVHGPMTAVLWDTWGVVNQAFVRVLVCDAFHSGCNRVLVLTQSADAHWFSYCTLLLLLWACVSLRNPFRRRFGDGRRWNLVS